MIYAYISIWNPLVGLVWYNVFFLGLVYGLLVAQTPAGPLLDAITYFDVHLSPQVRLTNHNIIQRYHTTIACNNVMQQFHTKISYNNIIQQHHTTIAYKNSIQQHHTTILYNNIIQLYVCRQFSIQ